MERVFGAKTLRTLQGDITQVKADAIVNAANEQLLPGGGVCGAIYRKGGAEIFAECAEIGHCVTGDAVATGAGELNARHVIHAVAPMWRGGDNGEPVLLRNAYRRSLQLAEALGDVSVAFPSLGTGIYGYPVRDAASVALSEIALRLQSSRVVETVTFVLFSQNDLDVYDRVLEAL